MELKEKIAFNDIIDIIELIEEKLTGKAYGDFINDRKSVIDITEQIAGLIEFVSNMDPNSKQAYSGVPWSEIEGLRTSIMSDELGIDEEKLWNISKHNLLKFKKVLVAEIKNN